MRPVLVLSLILLLCIGPATAQDDPPGIEATVAFITAPTDNSTISGPVVIEGSAAHPAVFDYYSLEFDNLSDPNEVWLPIAEQVAQQKTGDTLGIWNTVRDGIADGNYQIRLQVFLTDPELPPVTVLVTNLTLVNTSPTPPPTVPSEDEFNPSPTVGPSPTSPIDQPPTNTPRPTIAPLVQDPPASTAASSTAEEGSDINFSRIQNAFCLGGGIALIFFALLGTYLWVRARFRPIARQLMYQIRSEIDND